MCVGFHEWTAQFNVWKTTGNTSSEACAIACQNCAVYSVFPSGMTSHSKIAQFNWECIAPLRRTSAAARLLGSRDRIPLRAWTFVPCVRCVWCRWRPLRQADHSFSGVLPDVYIIMCDPRTWTIRRPMSDLGLYNTQKKYNESNSKRSWFDELLFRHLPKENEKFHEKP